MMSEKRYDITRRNALKKGALATGALIVGGTAATGTAAAGIGDGRVGHYHLNNLYYDRDRGEIVDNHVHDASPEDNDGTWVGGTDDPVVDGAVGNGFRLEKEGDFITVEDGISIPEGSDVSFAAWLYVDDWVGKNPGGWRAGSDPRVDFFNIFQGSTGRPWIRWGSGENILKPSDGYSVPTDEWVHVAYVVRSEDNAEFYANGELKHSTGHGAKTDAFDIYNIGWQYAENQRIVGTYDEVRFYDRALSSDEVMELATMDE